MTFLLVGFWFSCSDIFINVCNKTKSWYLQIQQFYLQMKGQVTSVGSKICVCDWSNRSVKECLRENRSVKEECLRENRKVWMSCGLWRWRMTRSKHVNMNQSSWPSIKYTSHIQIKYCTQYTFYNQKQISEIYLKKVSSEKKEISVKYYVISNQWKVKLIEKTLLYKYTQRGSYLIEYHQLISGLL